MCNVVSAHVLPLHPYLVSCKDYMGPCGGAVCGNSGMHIKAVPDASNWMAGLNPNLLISQVSYPGEVLISQKWGMRPQNHAMQGPYHPSSIQALMIR